MKFKSSIILVPCYLTDSLKQCCSFVHESTKGKCWETLANASDLDTICWTHSRQNKPFSTCLVGLPVDKWPIPDNIPPKLSQFTLNPVDGWGVWTKFLPEAPYQPQELEILGSVGMDFCIFDFSGSKQSENKMIDVTPNHIIYKNATCWCNYTMMTVTPSNQVPFELPQGVFLICGDRLWPAIPATVKGSPCSIGRLPLLTPNVTWIKEQKRRRKSSVYSILSQLRYNVRTWKKGQRFIIALLLPQAAIVLKQLHQMGCWLSKRIHPTTLALSDLLTDVNSVRQATLQNRAAIHYPLLVCGHGYEEFEGMCCMNLLDHSKCIHESIRQLEDGMNKLGEETGSWMDGEFNLFDL